MIFVPAVLLPSSIQRWILLAFSVLSVVSLMSSLKGHWTQKKVSSGDAASV